MNVELTSGTIDLGLLDFLNNPASYPHVPERITHIQTHISHVFISGSFVCKIKKPVNFDFLVTAHLKKENISAGAK